MEHLTGEYGPLLLPKLPPESLLNERGVKAKMNTKNESGDSRHSKSATPLGWYKWFPRDFLASSTVRRMSFTAQGVYRALLDLQWEDGFLHSYDDAAAILRLTPEEKSAFEPFYDLCFPDGINEKLDEQRQASLTYIERQRQVATGKPKARSKQAKSKPKASLRLANTEPTASPSPTETETTTETLLTLDKSSVGTRDVWDIPECLRDDRFLASWSAFVQHRRDIKKPISAVGGKALLHKLSKHDAELAADALDESLANGWQGVFPEKVERSERPGRTRSGAKERNSMLARIGSSIEELE
jgi:hypothetical protein